MTTQAKEQVLVTGGCGFIGRHLVARALRERKTVWIIDNLFAGRHPDQWLLGFERVEQGGALHYRKGDAEVFFIQRDVLDFFRGSEEGGFDLPVETFSEVFHLAAIIRGKELFAKDPILVGSNVALDAMLFRWATRRPERIGRLLYPSSAVVYPANLVSGDRPGSAKLSEHMIDFKNAVGVPEDTYGWVKLTGEYFARTAAKKYGIHIAVVRPFNGYGEDQELGYPIPDIARRIAREENPIEVWGTGEQGRDFVYVDDWVDGAFAALDHITDGSAVNVGSGKLTTFNQIIATLAKFRGYAPAIKKLLDKPVGAQSRYADMTRMQSFGWMPTVSLEEGLHRTLAAAVQAVERESKE